MQSAPTHDVQIAEEFVMAPSGAKVKLFERLCGALLAPVDISFLVFFRVVFGGILVWEVYRYFAFNRIARYYVDPLITFTYFGFSWVKPWPGIGMYIHFIVLGLAAGCVMLGFLYRFAAPVLFFTFTYFFLLDQSLYLNHFYLVSLISFLMCFLPAERAFSIDAWLRPGIRSDTVPAWTLWLLRLQIGIPFFYGGIAKINSDWILGGEPMRIWLRPLTRIPALGHLFAADWVVYSFVFGGLLLDLFVIPLLIWRRTRIYAFAAAVLFNLINALIFDIGIFPWLMLGALFIFFPPDLMRRFVRAFTSPEEQLSKAETAQAPRKNQEGRGWSTLSTRQRVIGGLLAAYLLVQLVLPFRHYLYPGNVSWTEEGHNFAWHMKLRTKAGDAFFTVTHPSSGQTWTIRLEDYLKSHQVRKLMSKPEMLVQFAHYLADEKRREGYDNVEVRARVMVSLNGRQRQLLIDPEIDLAKQEISFLPTRWIVPLTTPLGMREAGGLNKQADESVE
jgi:hypothetical protein